jgi:septation ring formation regulator EzrA
MVYILILVVVLLFAIHFYRKAKRQSIQPFPEHWHKLLMENVLYYRNLSKVKQLVFQQKMMQFLSEVYSVGLQFKLEDIIYVWIAETRKH